MPADLTMPEVTVLHSDAARPYACHADEHPPGAEWSIRWGYCRHSLDAFVGSTDPRCPATCAHKAPASVVPTFTKRFTWQGGASAAQWAREQREARKR